MFDYIFLILAIAKLDDSAKFMTELKLVREGLKNIERKTKGGFAYVKSKDLSTLLQEKRSSLRKVSVSLHYRDTSPAAESLKKELSENEDNLPANLPLNIRPAARHSSISVNPKFKEKYGKSKPDWLIDDGTAMSSQTIQESSERDAGLAIHDTVFKQNK